MARRPEILFPLFAGLETLQGIGPKTAKLFENLHVSTPKDLLFTLPHAIVDRRLRPSIDGALTGDVVTVAVQVEQHRPAARKGGATRVFVNDGHVTFALVFFHAHIRYIEAQLPIGARRIISGKIEYFDGLAQIVHPDHMLAETDVYDIPPFEPVYPLTAGITQKAMLKASGSALARAPKVSEWIDPNLKQRENWPDWDAALLAAHRPAAPLVDRMSDPARLRLAYDEVFAHQLTLALARSTARAAKGRSSAGTGHLQGRVLSSLPYAPTGAQSRAIAEIAQDLAAPHRMNRLLQGDVGAGKTLVALQALLMAVEAGGQGVMMAPTEVLARQHLEGLQPLAQSAGVNLELLTGRDKGKERACKLAALASGEIKILVGTHAVFQKDVEFCDLRLAVVDEQHRFGVRQRMELSAKGQAVDMLVMTATPIPRTLSLAHYGDLDISVLDEKPPGRQPIKTALVQTSRMEEVVSHLRGAVAKGQQAYWVCPLVEESELSDMTAAEERFKRLRAELGEGAVSLVHGQMPPAEKDAAMADFISGKTQVLVATTVIEVGVNVPNATIIVVERAENFGLAQLHQLRGRVGRGSGASTCLLLYQAPLGETGRRRLEILRETEDGFVIAEEDLAMRGAGDMIGSAQSGLPRFRVADPDRHSSFMEIAQKDARKLLSDDPALTSERGKAAGILLWLMEQDKAIRLISVG